MNKYDLYDSARDALKTYDTALLEKTILDEDRDTLNSSYRYLSWTSSVPLPQWAMKTETSSGKTYKSKMMFEEVFWN